MTLVPVLKKLIAKVRIFHITKKLKKHVFTMIYALAAAAALTGSRRVLASTLRMVPVGNGGKISMILAFSCKCIMTIGVCNVDFRYHRRLLHAETAA